MKPFFLVLALASTIKAYPTEILGSAQNYPSASDQAQAIIREGQREDIFNASAQHIKTYGNHVFIAPTASDLRGPCPGLNALANHGYIPRNGYTTVHEATDAVIKVFGLGSDLALFLATYAAVVSGDLTTWSIGGPPSAQNAAPAAGQLFLGEGISLSHNIFESDASPTHPDTSLLSSPSARTTLFQTLYTLTTTSFDLPTLTTHRHTRFRSSTSQNPSFHHGPFTGLLIQPKSYTFIPRLMSNHSSTHPRDGHLSPEALKNFFAMSGPDASNGKFTHRPGHERIPENWYRRSLASPYDNKAFLADALDMGTQHPEFLSVGGNMRERVTSSNMDIPTGSDGGAYEFACLGYRAALHGAKEALSKVYEDEFAAGRAVEVLRGTVVPLMKGLGCSPWGALDGR